MKKCLKTFLVVISLWGAFLPTTYASESNSMYFDYESQTIVNHVNKYGINEKAEYLRDFVDKNVLGKIHDGANNLYTDYLIYINGAYISVMFVRSNNMPSIYNRLENDWYMPITVDGYFYQFEFSLNNTYDVFTNLVNNNNFKSWKTFGLASILGMKHTINTDWNSTTPISYVYSSTFPLHVESRGKFDLRIGDIHYNYEDDFPTYHYAQNNKPAFEYEETIDTSLYSSLEIDLDVSKFGSQFDFISSFEALWPHRTDIPDALVLDKKMVPYLKLQLNDGTVIENLLYDYEVDYATAFSVVKPVTKHFPAGMEDSFVGGHYGFCFLEEFTDKIVSTKVVVPFDNFYGDTIQFFMDFSVPIESTNLISTSFLETINLENYYGVIFSPKFTDNRLISTDVFANFRLEGAFGSELRFYDIEHPDAFKDYEFGENTSIIGNNKSPINYYQYVFKYSGINDKRVALVFYNNNYSNSLKKTLIQYDTRYFTYTFINSPYDKPIIHDPNTGDDYEFEGSDDMYEHNNSNKQGFFDNINAFLGKMRYFSTIFNSCFEDFFYSLPLIVQLFLRSVFGILLILIILKLGGYR